MAGKPSLEKFTRLVVEIEKGLRRAILEVLEGRYGRNWWARQAVPLVARFHKKWGRKDEAWKYIGIPEARRIITVRMGGLDNWLLFKPVFGIGRRRLQVILSEIQRTRSEVLHGQTDWDSLSPRTAGRFVGYCHWVLERIASLPGERQYREIGEILDAFELAGLVERVPITQGPALYQLTQRAKELLAERIDASPHLEDMSIASSAIFDIALMEVLLLTFGWTTLRGKPVSVPMPEETLVSYLREFVTLLGDQYDGLIEFVDEERRKDSVGQN